MQLQLLRNYILFQVNSKISFERNEILFYTLDFDEYFNNLLPSKNTRNPWFVEYWEETYKCKFEYTPTTIFNQNYTRSCSGLLMIGNY